MKAELVVATPDADLLVINAARASFGKEKEVFDEKDERLIRFLAREKHLLPFRHPHITLRCQAPMFVARQLGKHQTGMSWSEESRRYIDGDPDMFMPDGWRSRAANVKQGSGDETITTITRTVHDKYSERTATFDDLDINQVVENYIANALKLYNDLLDNNVAPELARMVLPQNMMITWVWTGSLLAWVHMIKERSGPTVQKETRDFAAMVKAIIEDVAPVSMAALMEE